MKQASFLPNLRLDHGGDVRRGRRKVARPFSRKHAIHVVLRSEKARGKWSLLTAKNERRIEQLLKTFARKYGIRVYRFVNVGNHLHLLVKTEARTHEVAKRDFQSFIRRFAGAVAMELTGAKKGQGLERNETGRGFWNQLAYSRLVEWGRQFRRVGAYFTKNFFEAEFRADVLYPPRELDDAWLPAPS